MNKRMNAACVALLALCGVARADVILVPGATLLGVSGDGMCAFGTMNGNAIRWTAHGGIEVLGPGSASAASADGSVVVGTSGGSVFRWTASTGMVSLGSSTWRGPAVSRDGSVVAFGSSNAHSYRWTAATGAVPLQSLSGIGADLLSYSMSGDGSVIVGTANYTGALQPVAWRSGTSGPATGLPWLMPNHPDGAATVVSGNGQRVIGYSSVSTSGASVEATYWDADGTIHRMYTPDSFIRLFGANEDGTIAIGIGTDDSYVWREGVGFMNLDETLQNDFGVNLGNWPQAWGLSDNGQVVVGYHGTSDGNGREGFIVTLPRSVPGPGGLGVLGLGALAWARRRRGCSL